ncbi:MAG: hypothetical protein A2073_00665 [Deltaproteobacteria bacterium GWC2_42_11]|nr:MAG: hypothetical protein A2073_00665 [Deltaproteobacteria bacterium GWC2_42_11]
MKMQNAKCKVQNKNTQYAGIGLWVMPYCLLLIIFLTGCLSAGLREEASIHYRLGVSHLNDGNLPVALKELTSAVEKNPSDPSYHNALGLAYLYRGLDHEAIKHFNEAIKLDAKFSEAHTNLGAVYLRQKKWDDAISEFQASVANIFYTTPEIAYNNIGWAYYQKGENEKAIDNFKKAITANSKYSLAYNNMGLAYAKMNKDREAADAFNNAVRYSPDYADAHYNLGEVLIRLNDKKRAVESFQKVIKLLPDTEIARSAQEKVNLLK